MMARRISGSEGCGGGPLGSTFFSPTRSPEAPVLQIGESDAGHQRVPMQAGPGPTLEVAEAEVLFELLVRLLAGPARLDGGGQPPQRGQLRQIAEVVLLLAAVAPFADQPDRLAGQARVVRVGRSVRHTHPPGGEAGAERAFGAVAPGDAPPALLCPAVSAAVRGGRFGTGCLRARPVGVRDGRSSDRRSGRPSGCRRRRPPRTARVLQPWRKVGLLPNPASASTQRKCSPAAISRSISARAISGLVCAARAASGTPAAAQRSGSSVQQVGRNSRSPTGTGTSPRASVSETSTWQFAVLPSSPQYCGATPTEAVPFLGMPGVVDHQHGVRAADLPVGLLGEHAPQRRVIPGRAGDEVVQLVVPGQAEPLGHRLDALRPVRPQQAPHIQRRHFAPRAAAGHVEERLKPVVEVGRQCHAAAQKRFPSACL